VRAVRTTLSGLIDVGAVDALWTERRLVETVRSAQDMARVIAVVAGKGGVGGSTTAIGLARVLAALREDHVALVDAHAAAGKSLSQRVLGRPGPTVTMVDNGRRLRPPGSRRGLTVVDAAGWSDPASGSEIEDAVRRLADSYAITILDIGNDSSPAVQAALALADHAVLVTNAEPAAAASVQTALERAAGPTGDRPVTLVVVRNGIAALRRVRALLRRSVDAAPVVIPYDRALGEGTLAALHEVAEATRLAYLDLAGQVTTVED
jgi:MinD-like ATPase involved in chromosome partitioning or flagellar assembly